MGLDLNLNNLDLNAVKSTVSDVAVNAAEKVAGDKVDKKMVTDTVNTVVDQFSGIRFFGECPFFMQKSRQAFFLVCSC